MHMADDVDGPARASPPLSPISASSPHAPPSPPSPKRRRVQDQTSTIGLFDWDEADLAAAELVRAELLSAQVDLVGRDATQLRKLLQPIFPGSPFVLGMYLYQ